MKTLSFTVGVGFFDEVGVTNIYVEATDALAAIEAAKLKRSLKNAEEIQVLCNGPVDGTD